MASPQLQNGYARVANEIFEALAKTSLNGSQFRIILAIIRENYGRDGGRKFAHLPTRTLSTMTGLPARSVRRELSRLISIGVLSRLGDTPRHLYGFQKDYDKWSLKIRGGADQSDRPDQSDPRTNRTEKAVQSDRNGSPIILSGRKKKKHAASPHADPRFKPILDFYFRRVGEITGSRPDWDGADGNQLKAWLKEHPEENIEQFNTWLENAFRSTATFPLRSGFRMTEFLKHRMKYMGGPLYEKNQGNGKPELKNTPTLAELTRNLERKKHEPQPNQPAA